MENAKLKLKPESFLNICRRLDPDELDFWKDPMNYFKTKTDSVATVDNLGRDSTITLTFKSAVDKTLFVLYHGDLIEEQT